MRVRIRLWVGSPKTAASWSIESRAAFPVVMRSWTVASRSRMRAMEKASRTPKRKVTMLPSAAAISTSWCVAVTWEATTATATPVNTEGMTSASPSATARHARRRARITCVR